MASGGEDRQKGIKELEKEVTCPVCQDHFQDPKILPCLHYYCKQCIQDIVKKAGANQHFPCPECRSDTHLPQNDPNQLPTAFFINRMKEVHARLEKVEGKVTAKCEMCPGGAATAFCRQCAGFICDKCTESHHRMKVFANHEVSTLEELKGGGQIIITKPPPPPTCKIHEEQAKIYCFDCKTLICRDCIVFDHKDHKCDFVKTATPVVKKELQKGLASLRDIHAIVRDAAGCVKESNDKIVKQKEMITASIGQLFEMLHKVLNQCEQDLKTRVSAALDKKIEQLASQEESTNISSAVIQSLIDFVEKNIANATEEELVSQHSQLLRRMKDARENVQNVKPQGELDIVVNTVSTEDLQHFCQLKMDVSIPTCAVHVSVEGEGKSVVGKELKIKVQQKNKLHLEIDCRLISLHNGVITVPKVALRIGDTYGVDFIPTVRGHHVLKILADGLSIPTNPVHLFVEMPPTQLGDPVKNIDMTDEPRGIVIKPTGEILISTRTAVVSTDKNGEKFTILTSSDQYDLFGIAVDQNDYIYVSDSSQDRLLKLNSHGEIIKTYNNTRKELMPRGVTVHNNEVYLCGCGTERVHILTTELIWKKDITLPNLRWPSEVVISPDGKTIYICDHESDEIVVCPRNYGKILKIPPRKLSQPSAICVSRSLIFVSEWGENQVSVLTKEGQLVSTFGQGQLQRPSRIALDSNGFVYVCDTGNRRVLVF